MQLGINASQKTRVPSELLTYPQRNLSAFDQLEKPATANRMRRSVPGKTVSVLLSVRHRAATTCDRWGEHSGDRVMRSSSFVGSSAAADCRAVWISVRPSSSVRA